MHLFSSGCFVARAGMRTYGLQWATVDFLDDIALSKEKDETFLQMSNKLGYHGMPIPIFVLEKHQDLSSVINTENSIKLSIAKPTVIDARETSKKFSKITFATDAACHRKIMTLMWTNVKIQAQGFGKIMMDAEGNLPILRSESTERSWSKFTSPEGRKIKNYRQFTWTKDWEEVKFFGIEKNNFNELHSRWELYV